MKIKYFAGIREKVGKSEEEFSPAPRSLEALETLLKQRYPHLQEFLPSVRFAVNLEFVEKQTLLQETDEVALIPPVSGG
jgi:molybdopterin synthase sulfur carrier subunit